jgi:hypothetical protein
MKIESVLSLCVLKSKFDAGAFCAGAGRGETGGRAYGDFIFQLYFYHFLTVLYVFY